MNLDTTYFVFIILMNILFVFLIGVLIYLLITKVIIRKDKYMRHWKDINDKDCKKLCPKFEKTVGCC